MGHQKPIIAYKNPFNEITCVACIAADRAECILGEDFPMFQGDTVEEAIYCAECCTYIQGFYILADFPEQTEDYKKAVDESYYNTVLKDIGE